MGKSNISLTKTCNSCGQQKPLSAFLELSGPQGTTYGNICASCRKANIENISQPKEPEDSTRSTTGIKIDAKAKVQGEKDKRELRKQIEEQYHDEREKLDEKQFLKEQKIQHVTQDEKKHRKEFLEKRSFLDSTKKSDTNANPIFGGEEQKAEAGKIDLTKDTGNLTRMGATTKTQNPIFRSFQNWLGNTPIVNAAKKTAAQKNNHKNSALKNAMEPLNEEVEKNFKPRSKT